MILRSNDLAETIQCRARNQTLRLAWDKGICQNLDQSQDIAIILGSLETQLARYWREEISIRVLWEAKSIASTTSCWTWLKGCWPEEIVLMESRYKKRIVCKRILCWHVDSVCRGKYRKSIQHFLQIFKFNKVGFCTHHNSVLRILSLNSICKVFFACTL